ncbi:Protein phosphatase 2C [Amycolatopsis xylanica]|uniref:Protein phosphatase 2C n=1 Tax=Amycolatopsis xylanica TaxID=589385 RepID=A0A1H3T464_9PSEU|nr:protein phosphatase 2C domain-containing protein [Amycolatopsis xylanica]SDZ44139.1 Protein phosphatase 2C [Amycolatopsis xylanica]
MPEVEVAEHPGVGLDGRLRPTEDHVLVLPHAVILLDGATQPRPDLPTGGWYAGLLIEELGRTVTVDSDLADALARAIENVARDNGLKPRDSPSSTVAIARWTEDRIDALVLADSPIVACGRNGIEAIVDDRLASLRSNKKLRTSKDVYQLRNVEGGFWVAEADPKAAYQAVRRSWRREDVDVVMLASDGVSAGVDEYQLLSWADVAAMKPHEVLETVRAAEREDAECERWPRSKIHDDQALAVVRFQG